MTNVLIFKIKKLQAFINQREKTFILHTCKMKHNILLKKNNHNCTFPGKQLKQSAGREAVRATE